MGGGEMVQLVIHDAGEQPQAMQAGLERRRLAQRNERVVQLAGGLQREAQVEVAFGRVGLEPKELLKIANGVCGIAFSESVVSLLEPGLRLAILRNSKLAAENQNQRNRQQAQGRTEHDHKHSRFEKGEAGDSGVTELSRTFIANSVAQFQGSPGSPSLPPAGRSP